MERPDREEALAGVIGFARERLAPEAVDELGVARRIGQPNDRNGGFGERGNVRPLHNDGFRVVDDERFVLGQRGKAEGKDGEGQEREHEARGQTGAGLIRVTGGLSASRDSHVSSGPSGRWGVVARPDRPRGPIVTESADGPRALISPVPARMMGSPTRPLARL